MLTPPKWQTLWLKSKYFSRNGSSKIMFFKPAEKILDDVNKCCNSTSKELTLDALACWKMWLENQQIEDWKQNELCYSAVRPLLTKKFHPLLKDCDIIEIKLSLMWFAVHKVQHLLQFEGPQHVLEVFIQSCLAWLACSEDINPKIVNLILQLLNSLFSKDIQICYNQSFPQLKVDLLQSNKLFSRFIPLFMEVFSNWTKIINKTDLLCIWNNFLGHCERSFKLIPVAAWHKIFKLIENICADEKEIMKNKLAVLHNCATSLKSVMYNSKFIDCSQLLTTPAEALLKLVIELSAGDREENKSFEIFKYCHEICKVLSNHMIHTLGYESCIFVLAKIEEINSKTLLWGLWCGLADCFKEKLINVNIKQYSKIELKMFRKLRSVAVNFDLDIFYLDEKSISMIQNQLCFLRIGNSCRDCSWCNSKEEGLAPTKRNDNLNYECHSLKSSTEKAESFYCNGHFGFIINNSHINNLIRRECRNGNIETSKSRIVGARAHKLSKTNWALDSAGDRWLKSNFSLGKLNMNPQLLLCDTSFDQRLIVQDDARRRFVLAPVNLTDLFEKIIQTYYTTTDWSSCNFIENAKKIWNKLKKGQFFFPIKFSVSLKGKKGVDFCEDILQFWRDLDEIVQDVDFKKNLSRSIITKDGSILCLCMFLFLVNFTKNLFIESSECDAWKCKELFIEEKNVFSKKIISFIKNVMDYKKRLSKTDFFNNISKILQRKDDSISVLRTNSTSPIQLGENDNYVNSYILKQEYYTMPNDELPNFKYFDEFQVKFSNEVDSITAKKKTRGKGRRNRKTKKSQNANDSGLFSNFDVDVPRNGNICGRIWENKKVKVILAPPDVFHSLAFSELSLDIIPRETETSDRNRVSNYEIQKISQKKIQYNTRAIKKTDVVNESAVPRRRKRRASEIGSMKCTLNKEAKQIEVIPNKRIKSQGRDSELSNSSRITRENHRFPNPKLKTYFLRQLPKTKETNNLSRHQNRSLAKQQQKTPKNHNARSKFNRRASKNKNEETLTSNKDPILKMGLFNSNTTSETTEENEVKCEVENDKDKEDCETIIDIKRKLNDEEIDTVVIDVVYLMVEAVVENEIARNKQEIGLHVKSEFDKDYKRVTDNNEANDSATSPLTSKRVKRPAPKVEENCVKRLKLDTNEDTTKKIKIKADILSSRSDESQDSCARIKEESPKKNFSEEDSGGKKSCVPVAQSRGSRMLSLIAESPKIEYFCDNNYSSRQSHVKPHVNRNSRASKMLALLPEIQEISNAEENVVEESRNGIRSIKEDGTEKETSGFTPGKTHHLTPNRNSLIVTGSPKLSTPRQRKSIRFDDDKNETVTYYTDWPPCIIVRRTPTRDIEK